MKLVNLWGLLFLSAFIISCSTSKNKNEGEFNNTAAIVAYKDSIDKKLNTFTEQRSLPYTLDDYTFLVSKFSHDDRAVLLVEQGYSVKYGNLQKRYYLKNKKLVLYTETVAEKPKTSSYIEKRAFFRDGVQFAAYEAKVGNRQQLYQAAFKERKPLLINIKKMIRTYDQALNQTGQFDLGFDAIIEYPKARYIVLGNPRLNPYRSALLILKHDPFINELMNNPLDYRGRRLKMNWSKRNNEYVYLSGRLK